MARPTETGSTDVIDLDLRKLRVLAELGERGTVSAVAQALHLTPSAVSQQISALGRELGVQLTEPSGRRLRLTKAARVVLEHATTIFAQVEQMQAELAALENGEVGEVAVAGFSTTLSSLILPAVARLKDTRPHLHVTVAESDPPESFAMLLRGQTDVVISAESEGNPAALNQRLRKFALCHDPFDVALPARHPKAASTELRLTDLAEEKWIFATAGMCHDIGVSACLTAGFTPRESHAIGDWDATMTAVGLGLGVALLPRLAQVAPRTDVVIRALSDAPSRLLFAAVREGSQSAPEIQAVLDTLRVTAAEVVRSVRIARGLSEKLGTVVVTDAQGPEARDPALAVEGSEPR
ncbi:LysR family transcriptional regulator [Microbispora rosea subsp. aerata]|nr:LysR family transcriptional regulator [Microbispora rosea subsp. aerata]GIH57639.1 LysR family transcriptional regulator [Microbispora rosea subsp. aerata]GLJ86817.1 LysR family transcriptional regulator [Microbispora rosea subsp. aerata]